MLHTHYDNLKIARNAPVEVIRAAYRALAQTYHPDVNPSADAARIMKILNEAWEVLGDKYRRAQHDRWIAEQESRQSESTIKHEAKQPTAHAQNYTYSYNPEWKWESKPPPPGTGQHQGATKPKSEGNARKKTNAAKNNTPKTTDGSNLAFHAVPLAGAIAGAVACGAIIIILAFEAREMRPWPPQADASAAAAPAPAEKTSFTIDELFDRRPAPAGSSIAAPSYRLSPNGEPWPSRAGYLPGFKIRAGGGLSKLTVDNTRGGSNVHVKLCRPSHGPCDGLRHVYIPDGTSFSMRKLSPGVYEVRYRDLSSGAVSKSEPILVEEEDDGDRTRFSAISLTLYRVTGGNTRFTSLREDQF